MKTLKDLTGDLLEQMIDFKVVDEDGGNIGTLHSVWSDPTTGAVEFLGVKTGWIFGQNHVVPAEKAELDEAASVIRLPYAATFIKDAPSVSAEAEISEDEETKIYEYYGLGAETPSAAGSGLRRTFRAEMPPASATANMFGSTGQRTAPVVADSAGAVLDDPDRPVAPAETDAHWETAFREAAYYDPGLDYSDYAPAYRVGQEGYGRHGAADRDYAEVESQLAQDYAQQKGSSRLSWETAKYAVRDAWERLRNRAAEVKQS